jgi:hypothetical protein
MRRAIVHIGMPRTGTASLQAALSAHRREFAQAGVLYPDLRPRRELRDLSTMLDGQLAATTGDVVILSDEGLSQLPSWHSAPSVLRELLARHGFAMEIAVMLEAQDLYAQSCYTWRCELLRERRFFAASLPGILRQLPFSYLACVRPWAIAAAGRVVAVPVHERGSDAPLIERLLRYLGLEQRLRAYLQPRDLLRREQRSMSPAAIEVARRIRERAGAQRNLARVRDITEFVATETCLRGFATTPFQALDRATRERVMAGFSASNDRFARSIWGENWSRRVAEVELAPVNAFGPDAPPDHADAQLESVALQVCRHFGLPVGHGLLARMRALFEPPLQARHR